MEGNIILWDLMLKPVWQDLNKQGHLTDPPDWPPPEDLMYTAHAWLGKQFALRVHESGRNRVFRLSLLKFDLRYYRWHMPKGNYVRVGFRIPKERVLLFDDCHWFCGVLVNRYIARAPEEEQERLLWESDAKNAMGITEDWDNISLPPDRLPPSLGSRLTQSWERVFDITHTEDDCMYGAVDALHLAEVFSITEFTAVGD